MRSSRRADAYARALRPLLGDAAGYARAILRSRHGAEDAIQQAALRGWERFDSYDETRPFKGWWFAIVRNCCIDMLRQAGRGAPQDWAGAGAFDQSSSEPEESGDWKALDDALLRLSDAHREVLRLKYFGALSYEEIAAALHIPRGTVMSRLHLARKALAAELEKEEP